MQRRKLRVWSSEYNSRSSDKNGQKLAMVLQIGLMLFDREINLFRQLLRFVS